MSQMRSFSTAIAGERKNASISAALRGSLPGVQRYSTSGAPGRNVPATPPSTRGSASAPATPLLGEAEAGKSLGDPAGSSAAEEGALDMVTGKGFPERRGNPPFLSRRTLQKRS
jgi:hypothetical protein